MRTLAYAVVCALTFSLENVVPQPLWTEAEIVVLVDNQPITSAEVTLDGSYLGESPQTVMINNYFDHDVNIFVDEVQYVRERSRDLHVGAGSQPTKIVINFASR